MRIYAPEVVNSESMYSLLGQIFDEMGMLRTDQFIFDFTQSVGIEAAGLVMLDNVFLRLAAEGCFVRIVKTGRLPAPHQKILDLLSNSLPDEFLDEAIESASGIDGEKQRIKFDRCSISQAETRLFEVFNDWLAHELYVSALLIEPNAQCFTELIENVRDHAGVQTVSIGIASNPGENEIRFVLSDAGRGIPESIRAAWKEKVSDEVAIAKAIEGGSMKERARANTGRVRREGGLGRLVREFVNQRAGSMTLISGFGRLFCRSSSGSTVYTFVPANAYYPGTMIEVTFSTDTLQSFSTLNEPLEAASFILK